MHSLSRGSIGIAYHTVDDRHLPHVSHLYAFKSPAQFEEDIRYLLQNYTVVDAADLRPIPSGKPRVLMCFDDGMSQCFDVVRPILLRHGVPCLFFIVPSFIDNNEMFFRHKVSLCIDGAQRDPGGSKHALTALGEKAKGAAFDYRAFAGWLKSLSHEQQYYRSGVHLS